MRKILSVMMIVLISGGFFGIFLGLSFNQEKISIVSSFSLIVGVIMGIVFVLTEPVESFRDIC